MILHIAAPYIATIVLALVAAAVRTLQLRPGTKHPRAPRFRYPYYATLLLTFYLAINLVTEAYAYHLAIRYVYNHHVYALNILLGQVLLCASLCHFAQRHPLMLSFSLLVQPIYLYTYFAGQYWRPETVMPQSLYAGHNALMAIAALLFCGIALYRQTRSTQRPGNYFGLGLICLLYHFYLQLADSFQLSETLAQLLHINDLILYLTICGSYYLAIAIYLIRQTLNTTRHGK